MSPDAPLRITWWEHDQLVEHLEERDDIWMSGDDLPGLWLRFDRSRSHLVEDEPKDALMMQLVPPPDDVHPYRQYQIQLHPQVWEHDFCQEYVLRLLRGFTAYGRRERIVGLLTSLGIPDPELIAIAIEGFDWLEASPATDAEATVPEAQMQIFAQEIEPRQLIELPISDPMDLGTYLLQGNVGWLRLRLAGGQIRCSASVRGRNEAGWTTLLEGYVRPPNGRVRDAAATLAGWSGVVDAVQSFSSQEQLELKDPEEAP